MDTSDLNANELRQIALWSDALNSLSDEMARICK